MAWVGVWERPVELSVEDVDVDSVVLVGVVDVLVEVGVVEVDVDVEVDVVLVVEVGGCVVDVDVKVCDCVVDEERELLVESFGGLDGGSDVEDIVFDASDMVGVVPVPVPVVAEGVVADDLGGDIYQTRCLLFE